MVQLLVCFDIQGYSDIRCLVTAPLTEPLVASFLHETIKAVHHSDLVTVQVNALIV